LSKISKESEIRINEIIIFILEAYKKESIKQNLEIFTELILISRIIYKRFKLSHGIKTKDDKFIKLAKNKILTEIKVDENYENIKKFINNHISNKLTN
tara:strand:- start:5706 stop:5999 length:294 start_codon:yes stop_codon:yes gene_type:complete